MAASLFLLLFLKEVKDELCADYRGFFGFGC